MAPSTLGTFLRSLTFGHVRQVDRLAGEFLSRAWAAGAGVTDPAPAPERPQTGAAPARRKRVPRNRRQAKNRCATTHSAFDYQQHSHPSTATPSKSANGGSRGKS